MCSVCQSGEERKDIVKRTNFKIGGSDAWVMPHPNLLFLKWFLFRIVVYMSHLIEIVNRQEDCQKFCHRHRKPDSVDSDKLRKNQDICNDHSERAYKGNDRGNLPVGKCGKHGRCKNVDSGKYIVE